MTRIATEAEAEAFVREARAARTPFEIMAGGTRRGVGQPMAALPVLDVSGLSGIVSYEPEELIITVAPGTSLAEIDTEMAARQQRLGFDPMDWSGLLGTHGTATIGGVVSAEGFGPGRLRHGPPRDSLLAFRGVNGLGETIRGGGKVVKNVTGFDLPKLVCGAFGTLCVLTELTFRVYPRPSQAVALVLADVTPVEGLAALRKIARSALEASALCYLPAGNTLMPDVGRGAAIIRLEGAAQPLAEKVLLARGLLGGDLREEGDGAALLSRVGQGDMFTGTDFDVWRVFVPAADAPRVAAEIAAPLWLADLAGGLLWMGVPAAMGAHVRTVAASVQGEAMLLRAAPQTRAMLGLYAPPTPALAKLRAQVKAAFDPDGLFNPGRFTSGNSA